MAGVPDAGIEDYLATVAVARLVLGPGMRIQARQPGIREECLALVAAGVDDWAGIALTPDHVNPNGLGPLWPSWPPSPRRPATTWCSG